MLRWSFWFALLACGANKPAVTGPSELVKRDIERAEKAEENRDHNVARKYYEKAIGNAKDPISIGYARREFAETLATWGEIESALGQLEKAVAATPDDPIAWQMLGIIRASDVVHDIPGAFTALEKSKQLAPRSYIPRRDLAVLHWKLGHKQEALAEYKAMLELDLPTRLRDKVEWAIEELEKSDSTAQPPPGPAPAPTP
ncbi:MAG TPA: hypothetical protein VIV11_15710 [Kofleriaceae bacterium]